MPVFDELPKFKLLLLFSCARLEPSSMGESCFESIIKNTKYASVDTFFSGFSFTMSKFESNFGMIYGEEEKVFDKNFLSY